MKWIMHSTGIMIGRNIILISIFLLLGAFQCGEEIEPKDNNYGVWVTNNSASVIKVIFKDNNGNFNSEYNVFTLNTESLDKTFSLGSIQFNNDESELDPVKQFLNNQFYESKVEVYRNDSLKVTWSEPAVDLPVSTHSFFNYNSWEVILTPDVPDQMGTLNFYIEEEDLE